MFSFASFFLKGEKYIVLPVDTYHPLIVFIENTVINFKSNPINEPFEFKNTDGNMWYGFSRMLLLVSNSSGENRKKDGKNGKAYKDDKNDKNYKNNVDKDVNKLLALTIDKIKSGMVIMLPFYLKKHKT